MLYKGAVLDLSKWKKHHPGGAASLEHCVGLDVSQQIHCFHPEHVSRSQAYKFAIGRLVNDEGCFVDTVDIVDVDNENYETAMKNARITANYFKLSHKIQSLDLHKPNYAKIVYENLRCFLFFGASLWLHFDWLRSAFISRT